MVCFLYGAPLMYRNWATVSFRNCPKENSLEYNACDVFYCALYATGDEWLASYFSAILFFFQFLSIGSYLMRINPMIIFLQDLLVFSNPPMYYKRDES